MKFSGKMRTQPSRHKRKVSVPAGSRRTKHGWLSRSSLGAFGFVSLLGLLTSLVLYLLTAPLPKLPSAGSEGTRPAGHALRARSLASLDSYLELLKVRDLFKPSIPIPAEKKVSKTTAEQLAERLRFLGTSGDGQDVCALVFIAERGPGLFRVGDRVAEFILRHIEKDRLVLELESEQVVIKR